MRDHEDGVCLDVMGRKPGRGAYVCPDERCFNAARDTGKFERALRVKISDVEYQSLHDGFLNAIDFEKRLQESDVEIEPADGLTDVQ